jgi:hypothetical protein
MMKQSLKKQPRQKQITMLTQVRNLTSLESIPAASVKNSSKSLGNPVVELATSKGTINLLRERIKTLPRSMMGRLHSRYDEVRKPLTAGRMGRNCPKVFRVHKME